MFANGALNVDDVLQYLKTEPDLVQYPASDGSVKDYRDFINSVHGVNAQVVMAKGSKDIQIKEICFMR